MKNRFSPKIITALAWVGISSIAIAEEELNTIDIFGYSQGIEDKKIGETVKTSEVLNQQQVQSTRDMVKYETGISVVEKGRMGSSGYAVRGVEENRVNISIDGLQQAQTISSQGFNELFAGYGNFNNTRNGIEIENIKDVNLAKGADSTKVGSGSLGGSVIFQTKDARDYLEDKNYFYKMKAGYSSANNERMLSHTGAFSYKSIDALLVRTDRKAHELENYDYDNYDSNVQGRSRQKADPYDIGTHSTLLKLSYNLSDTNRFTLMYDDSTKHSKGSDWSYTLANGKGCIDPSNCETKEFETRHANDSSTRKNMAFSYDNHDSNPLWDSAKVTFSHQKITQRARTDDYCDGGEHCTDYDNPVGLHLKGNTIVDKEGNPIDPEKVTTRKYYDAGWGGWWYDDTDIGLKDSKGEPYKVEYYKLGQTGEIILDCQAIDCDGKFKLFKIAAKENVGSHDIDLSAQNEWVNHTSGDVTNTDPNSTEYARFTLTDINYEGKKYKKIDMSNLGRHNGNNIFYYTLTPNSLGYHRNAFKQRDLNTESKNLRIDLEKSLEMLDTEHAINYGLMYDITEKSMINRQAQQSIQPKWWAKVVEDNGRICVGPCNAPESVSSFLIPVTTMTGSLHLSDSIRINNWLGVDLGYRYDRVSYRPEYTKGKTAKIPDDMVKGLFVPLPKIPNQPSWSDGGWSTPTYPGCMNSACIDYSTGNYQDIGFGKAMDDYKKKKALAAKNPGQNIAYLVSQKRKFTHHSYSLAATIDPAEFLRVQAKFSKGFRAPTSDEIFFTFKHPDFTILPNVDLEPEFAKTKELAFTFYKDRSYLTLSAFRTDYKNFIDLEYKGKQSFSVGTGGGSIDFSSYQNVNQQSARVHGFEVESKVFLDDFTQKLEGFNVGYKYTHQTGKIKAIDGNHPMNAIQPNKHVLSLGYVSPDNDYGLNLYVTHVDEKKSEDSYNQYHKEEGAADSFARYRSKSYSIFDVMGFYRPTKNMTIQAGVYNIFNKEYTTWDNMRSVRSFGTSNMVCQRGDVKSLGCGSADQGIERFSSPERNFKVGVELRF